MADETIVNMAVVSVERLCEPDAMSKAAAIDFLGDVISRLQSSMEALEVEIENGG